MHLGNKTGLCASNLSTSSIHSLLVFCNFEINKINIKNMLISTKGIKLLLLTLFFVEILETSLENLETIHFPILVSIKSYASIGNFQLYSTKELRRYDK